MKACADWKLKVEDAKVESSAFLGKGAFGRVFKVSSKDTGKEEMALKLVLSEENGGNLIALRKEKDSMDRAAETVPSVVVKVIKIQTFDLGESVLGGAMLLSEVGKEVPKAQWEGLFAALGLLHEGNILHGDPRKENGILVEGSVKWIDFFASCVVMDRTSIREKQFELITLMKSCYGGQVPQTELTSRVATYNGTSTGAVQFFNDCTTSFGLGAK